MYETFTDRARKVMQLANQEAQRLNHEYIGTEHILLGLVKEGSGTAANVLKNRNIDLRKIQIEIEKIVQSGPDAVMTGKLPHTPRAKKVIEYSIEEARNLNHNFVGTEHLLLGLLREEEGVAAQVLKYLALKFDDAREEVLNLVGHMSDASVGRSVIRKTSALDTFGRDLTELARHGQLDPTIGRVNEIEAAIQVLCRLSRNNPIFLAEAGVPTLPIVEFVAQLIADGSVPAPLSGRRLVSLDVGLMTSRERKRVSFTDRIAAVINEIRRGKPRAILFLDALQYWFRRKAFSAVLKGSLRSGEIQVLAATTPGRWARMLKREPELEQIFRPVVVPPLSPRDCVELLRAMHDRYEAHHHVLIRDEALDAAVSLADRHIMGCLPEKALDIIDEACARAQLRTPSRRPDRADMEAQIEKLNQEKEAAVAEQDFDKADKVKKKIEVLEREWRERASKVGQIVDENAISEVVSKKTGMPVTAPDREEALRLLRMADRLEKEVIGQAQAIDTVVKAIRRRRAGLGDLDRPIASFIFVGPSGVGKTLLATRLAEAIFGGEEAVMRVEMSEYEDEQSAGRFLETLEGRDRQDDQSVAIHCGNSPGVILLENIERAHPRTRSVLLTIMEKGKLRSRAWPDFRNSVLIMTTAFGAEAVTKGNFAFGKKEDDIDEHKTYARIREAVAASLGSTFAPGFLAPIDEVVVFRSLTNADMKRIFDIESAKLAGRLKEMKLNIVFTEEAMEFFIERALNQDFGARALRRAFVEYLETPLADELLKGAHLGRDTVNVRKRETIAGQATIALEFSNSTDQPI
jgi:ATP-dependent Clp protease ATP-binding subunit ClpC